MSKIKRVRAFAGPNGSGKTTLFEEIKKQYPTGNYINADWIEKELTTVGYLDLSQFDITATQSDWGYFTKTEHAKSLIAKSQSVNHNVELVIRENVIVDQATDMHSYEAALIASFIRFCLMAADHSYSFETVMSHKSKIDELASAQIAGYKTYLYFICLDDPMLNMSRVSNRVSKGGHNVDTEKIQSRYHNTLCNLLPAMKIVDRSFLFDNSDTEMRLIAESDQQVVTLHCDGDQLPNWFINYVADLLNKN